MLLVPIVSVFTILSNFHLIQCISVPADYRRNDDNSSHKQLMVLMLDGFRWDYLDMIPDDLGGFEEFVVRGARAEYVNGIFPTLSYPSWTSLSTGLYAENHGILGNYFYDREEDHTFELNAPNNQLFWWQEPEPIWTTATLNDKATATIYWSRSEIPVGGVIPKAPSGYEMASDWTSINQTLNKCLAFIEDGFDLVLAYGEHIDNVGHKYGPNSSELKQALIDVGKVLGQFFENVRSYNLDKELNVLLVSDHGMKDVTFKLGTRHTYLRLLTTTSIDYILDQGALSMIYTLPGEAQNVIDAMRPMEGVHIYKKHEIPQSFHFAKNERVPDILVVAKEGYLIIGTHGFSNQIPEAWHSQTIRGTHGYEPAVKDMRTVFMATGPDFKEGVILPPIDLVDIYQVYCHLLEIKCPAHNGTWSRVDPFFTRSVRAANGAPVVPATTLLVLVVLLATVLALH